VGGYRTRSYVDDYAHLTRYRYGQLELRFVLTDHLLACRAEGSYADFGFIGARHHLVVVAGGGGRCGCA
ncbi:MAG: hypothetical protein J0L65_16160, partial [Xanthomonadales bacterium]|nr:hypothetical protein [Xanthomonadales bacterium]